METFVRTDQSHALFSGKETPMKREVWKNFIRAGGRAGWGNDLSIFVAEDGLHQARGNIELQQQLLCSTQLARSRRCTETCRDVWRGARETERSVLQAQVLGQMTPQGKDGRTRRMLVPRCIPAVARVASCHSRSLSSVLSLCSFLPVVRGPAAILHTIHLSRHRANRPPI